MSHRLAWAGTVLIIAALLSGCAGGWRHGAAPGADSPAAPAAKLTAPSADASAPAATASGATFAYRGDGNSVALAGGFNNWSTSADPMVKQADGSWTLTKKLEPGTHQYKFVIDGTTWKEDPNAKEFVDDGFGGKNSVIVIGAGAAPQASAAVAAPAAKATASGKGKAPVLGADGVTFTFGGAASSVNLAGDFNAWSTTADPMVKQTDGTWTLTKKLEPGTYEYKFVIDASTWKPDEANPESKSDPYGGKNSVITVK